MKTRTSHTLSILLLFLLSGCLNSEKHQKNENESTLEIINQENKLELQLEESANYLKNRDFDGDGKNDHLLLSHSGGAHCCYKMSVKLSSRKDTLNYPFEMDGGYAFGMVDGSKPDQFSIEDCDGDGLPEILMRISTYNGEKHRLKQEWTNTYGIKTTHIVFDFQHDSMVVHDNDVNLK